MAKEVEMQTILIPIKINNLNITEHQTSKFAITNQTVTFKSIKFTIRTQKDLENTLKDLNKSQWPFMLITDTVMTHLFAFCKNPSVTKGRKSVITSPRDILQMNTAHQYNVITQELQILFQLPMLTQENLLDLYQLKPVPITDSIKPNHSMILEAEEQWVAVGSSQKETWAINPIQLQTCKVFSNIYICHNQKTMNFTTNNTCLSALYWEDWPMVQKWCNFKFQPKSDQVFQLNNNNWLVAPSKPVTTVTKCNSKITSAYIIKQTIVKIPLGCQLEFSNQIIYSDYNIIPQDNEVKMLQWNWTTLTLFPLFNTTAFNLIISYLQETDTVTITFLNHVVRLITKSEYNSNAQPLTQDPEWDLMEYIIITAIIILFTGIILSLNRLLRLKSRCCKSYLNFNENLQMLPIFAEMAALEIRARLNIDASEDIGFQAEIFESPSEDIEMPTRYIPNGV